MKYDIAIIGAGPAGYTAAMEGATQGKKIILFEKDKVGGLCLNKGCIPMKTFLNTPYDEKDGVDLFLKNAKEQAAKNIKVLEHSIQFKLKRLGVNICYEEVISIQNNVVETGLGNVYEAEDIIIATGSEAKKPCIEGLEYAFLSGKAILGEDIFSLEHIPQRVTIIGAGAVGIEIATLLSRLGIVTTVVERPDFLFKFLDNDVRSIVCDDLGKIGIDLIEGNITNVAIDNDDVIVSTHDGNSIDSELLIIATGRQPNVALIGSKDLKTCGDVKGCLMLAHSAYAEAKAVILELSGKTKKIDYECIPKVIYSNPEIAYIGLTEEAAVEKFGQEFVQVSVQNMAYSSRYIISSYDTQGIIKVIANRLTGNVLGAQIVGNGASELISIFALAIKENITIDKLRESVYPHPSIAEVISYL